MGREEVPPLLAVEFPALGEPTSEEQRHHELTYLPYESWCNVCVRARGREYRHEARSQVQPGTPVVPCDYCFLKTEEDEPNDHSFGSHRYSEKADGYNPS